MKQKMVWFIFAVILVVFVLLIFAQANAGAQALVTPTSPPMCLPATPMDAWGCLNGTAVPLDQLPTSTPAPTFAPQPTLTPQPYPGPGDAAVVNKPPVSLLFLPFVAYNDMPCRLVAVDNNNYMVFGYYDGPLCKIAIHDDKWHIFYPYSTGDSDYLVIWDSIGASVFATVQDQSRMVIYYKR